MSIQETEVDSKSQADAPDSQDSGQKPQVQTWNENEILATVLHRQTTGEGVGREIRVLAVTVDLDDDYAWTWYCNLKMTFMDSGATHQVARDGTVRFMRHLFGRDMTLHPLYSKEKE